MHGAETLYNTYVFLLLQGLLSPKFYENIKHLVVYIHLGAEINFVEIFRWVSPNGGGDKSDPEKRRYGHKVTWTKSHSLSGYAETFRDPDFAGTFSIGVLNGHVRSGSPNILRNCY